jgi:hypothetical protein
VRVVTIMLNLRECDAVDGAAREGNRPVKEGRNKKRKEKEGKKWIAPLGTVEVMRAHIRSRSPHKPELGSHAKKTRGHA